MSLRKYPACLLRSQLRLERFACLLFVFVVVSASVQLSSAQLWAQAYTPKEGIKVIDDIRYYSGEDADSDKHKLDLYLPENVNNGPALLWIHGGAWASGSRKQESLIAKQFASKGIAVAVMSYRLSAGNWMNPSLPDSGVVHPAHTIDVARAFAWMVKHAAEYGWSDDKLFVSGYSAGGHLSALLASDPRYLAAQDLNISDIRGAIPIAGAYDIEHYYQQLLPELGQKNTEAHIFGVFGPKETLSDAAPLTYLNADNAPMLVISERQTFGYAAVYEEAVINAGIEQIQFVHYMDKTHKTLYESMQNDDSRADARIVEFIEERCSAPQ